jgi:glycosyltransferase involved in cell wall biosynthesis
MAGMEVHRFRYFLERFERLAGSAGILPTLKKNKFYYLLVPFFVMAEFWALWRLVRQIKPDVVHAHWLIPQGLIAALVKKITGTPYVVTAHGGDVFGLQGGLFAFLKRLALESADRVTVVSTVIKQVVLATKPNVDPIVLPMGVDSTKFKIGAKAGSLLKQYDVKGPLLLFVGRLTEKKGVRYLLEAMPEVISKVPSVKLLVVGSGEEEDQLKQLSAALHLGGNVIFTGPLTNADLPQFYTAADIFIGPSIRTREGDTEGFGLTFVEAGMSGCILIGSRVGGITDIIEDGMTGFLVAEKNPAAITAALLTAISRQDEWPAMTDRTRGELVSRFDWQLVARGYAEILANVVADS